MKNIYLYIGKDSEKQRHTEGLFWCIELLMGCTVCRGRISDYILLFSSRNISNMERQEKSPVAPNRAKVSSLFRTFFFFLFFCTRSVWTAGRRISERPSGFFFVPPRRSTCCLSPFLFPLCSLFPLAYLAPRGARREDAAAFSFVEASGERGPPFLCYSVWCSLCFVVCCFVPAVGILCCSFLSLSFFRKGFFFLGGVLIYLSFYSELIRSFRGRCGPCFFVFLRTWVQQQQQQLELKLNLSSSD